MGGTTIDTIFDRLAAVRWLHFCAVFTLFGSFVFRRVVPAALVRVPAFAPVIGALATLVRIGAWIAAATGIGWIVLSLIDMVGSPDALDAGTVQAFFFQTSFGGIELARLALLAGLVAGAILPLSDDLCLAVLGVASGCLLVTQAWLGHAAEDGETPRGMLMLAVYDVHVLAAAVWVGGLVPLLLIVRELRRAAGARPALLALLSRISTVATIAVILILASGVANTAFRAGGDLGRLAASPYGHVLGLKLALLALMLALAAVHRFAVLPRLGRDGAAAPDIARYLPLSLGLELGAGALILAAAAVLGITPPPS